MAFKSGNKNLSDTIYGLGVSETYGGYECRGRANHFKIDGKSVKYVLRDTFMPFSDGEPIGGFTESGRYVFSNYAEIGRFIQGTNIKKTFSKPTGRFIPIEYLGGGTRNSNGILRINGDLYRNCPPVIVVMAQGGGGDGGTGNSVGVVVASNEHGGGGGGAGAFWVFYLMLPYQTGGQYVNVGISFEISSNKSIRFMGNNGIIFATVGAGENGASYSGGAFSGGTGKGGKLSIFSLPYNVKEACFSDTNGTRINRDDLSGADGGSSFELRDIWIPSGVGGYVRNNNVLFVSSSGLFVPQKNDFGGVENGASSRFGKGGLVNARGRSDAPFPRPAGGGVGEPGGIGAGGGGGIPPYSFIGSYYAEGGAGGDAYLAFLW